MQKLYSFRLPDVQRELSLFTLCKLMWCGICPSLRNAHWFVWSCLLPFWLFTIALASQLHALKRVIPHYFMHVDVMWELSFSHHAHWSDWSCHLFFWPLTIVLARQLCVELSCFSFWAFMTCKGSCPLSRCACWWNAGVGAFHDISTDLTGVVPFYLIIYYSPVC